MDRFQERRNRLVDSLDGDAFLVFSNENADPESLFYLTGFSGEGALLLGHRRAALLTDRRYTEVARQSVAGLDVVDVQRDYLGCMALLSGDWNLRQIMVAESRVTYGLVRQVSESLSARVIPVADPVASLRATKDQQEISQIREAVKLTEYVLDMVLGRLSVGCVERDVAVDLEFEMRRQGAEGVAFAPIVACGSNSANAHHEPGNRVLRSGDLLLIDVGARLNHYCADFTRVYSLGKPSAEAKALYHVVYTAQCAARDMLKTGANTRTISDAVVRAFAECGHFGPLAHGIGHGVGLCVHEYPELSRKPVPLPLNSVLAVEPGLYKPGFCGVRIEEMYHVSDDGADPITVPAPPELPRISGFE